LTGRSGKKIDFKKISGFYKDERPTLNAEHPTSNEKLEKVEHRISINEAKNLDAKQFHIGS
jgi:6-phosphogluconolactonase/glucosamine-6-phosphate isomerase/deaminase